MRDVALAFDFVGISQYREQPKSGFPESETPGVRFSGDWNGFASKPPNKQNAAAQPITEIDRTAAWQLATR